MRRGFTLIELLVVLGIVGLLASVVAISANSAGAKARDAKRKQAVSNVGRFLSGGACFLPEAGAGDYDLGDLAEELKARYPQTAAFSFPRDPKGGTERVTGYRYVVDAVGSVCAFYANLELDSEAAEMDGAPGSRRGTGTTRGPSEGRNGTTMFFQATN